MRYSIPWSGMLPVAGISLLMAATRPGLEWYERKFVTEGKPARKAMDYFDKIMAERDVKITGSMYRQQSHPFPE